MLFDRGDGCNHYLLKTTTTTSRQQIKKLKMIQTSNPRHHHHQTQKVMAASPRASAASPRAWTTNRSTGNDSVVSPYSKLASQAIGQGKYRSAVEYYQLALGEYLQDSPTVAQLVNAAATCFNLGALSKKLQEYVQAVDYFCQAEDLYRKCSEQVKNARDKPNQSASSAFSCEVCLLQLIVETLQARAHLHYKYQHRVGDAIECHEEVVTLLEAPQNKEQDTVYNKIHFTTLPQEERWLLQITSLQSLGKFYVERGEFEDGLMAYQDALGFLRQQPEPTRQRQDEIEQIVKALSEIYLKSNSAEVQLPGLQRLALVQEDLENWEKALQCWERVLYLQSQEFGAESMEVALTLCQLGRVMVAEGNHEGALDLYQAAAAKYYKFKIPLPRELISNIAQVYCQLQLQQDAIVWLKDLLTETETGDHKSWIFYELGKIYMEEGQLHEAGQVLCESAELSESDDEHVFKLLQKVEFLQQRVDSSGMMTPLTAIAEDHEESTIAEASTLTDERTPADQRPETSIISSPMLEDVNEEKKVRDESPITFPLVKRSSEVSLKEIGYEKHALDALVNGYLDTDDSNIERNDPKHVSDLSNSLTTATENRNDSNISYGREDSSSNYDVVVFKNENSGELSPIRCSKVYSESMLMTTPALDVRPFEDDAPEDEAKFVRPGSHGQERHESFSKSTDDTEPSVASVESSPDESSKGVHVSTRPHSIPLPPSRSPGPVSVDDCYSDDGSDFGADLEYIESGDDDDDEEDDDINTSGSESASHVSDLNCLDSLDEDDDQPMVVVDSHTDEGAHGKLKTLSPTSISPSPVTSSSSRMGLLKKEEKSSSNNNDKALRIPTLSSPRHKSKEKPEYSEIEQTSKPAPRNRFVKALASPFRRSRSKRNLHANGLGALEEDQEKNEFDDDVSESAAGAPVSFIAMRGRSATDDDDDDQTQVSQITFKMEEHSSRRRSQEGQWWWGVNTDGLGWFPTKINQAVQVAEAFLSAEAIHGQAKSRPLDFDSDDESEIEHEEGGDDGKLSLSNLKDSPHSNHSKSQISVQKPQNVSVSSRKPSAETSAARISSGAASTAPSNSDANSKKQRLSSQIQANQEVLETQILDHGPQHITVASTLFNLAILYSRSGDTSKAIENAQRALKIQKSTLNSSDACRSLYLMADMHSKENQYKPALSCLSEAQRLQERVLGYFHEDTAMTLNGIGKVLALQGQFDLAMENHKEALRILKECFGEDVKNPLVAQTLVQIGAVYYKERNSLATIQSNTDGYTTFIEGGMLEVIGRAHEERGSYRMAIAFFEEKLQFLNTKDDLEQVAETLNSLGMLSCRAGLYLEAIDYYDRALGIQMKLGCDDVQLAMARVLAGSVQYSLGHFGKALKLFQDAIRTLRDQVGSEQETVAATLFHMGVVRSALCDYGEAMSDLLSAQAIQKKLLGNDHPATLRTRREIGNLYAIYTSELDSAFKEYNEVLAAQKRIHGEKHPNVAETLHSLGCAQARTGDLSSALRTLEDCYNMRLEFLGMDHPLQATTLHEIAKIQLKRGRVKKATHICDSALNIRVESLSERHIDVAVAMATKATCLVSRGNFTDANKEFLAALSIAEDAVGPSHPSVAGICVQMGVMHLRKCHFEEASEAIRRALDIYRKSNLDEDHPGIKEAEADLERVERAEMLCV